MNARRSSRRLLQLFLSTAVALWIPACSRHKTPTAPLEPPASINATSVNVIAARGDTITTTDTDGTAYTVQVPAGALSADATVTLKTSAVSFSQFTNVTRRSTPLELTVSEPVRDSLRILIGVPATSSRSTAASQVQDWTMTCTISYDTVNGYQYAATTQHDRYIEVCTLPDLPVGAAAQWKTTYYVVNVTDQAAFLDAIGAVDLSDATRVCVVALHGVGQDAGDIKTITDRIASKYPVLTYTYPTQAHTPKENASVLRELLLERAATSPGKALRAPLVLVGYSMGGVVAREFAQSFDAAGSTQAILFLATPNNGYSIGSFKYFAAKLLSELHIIASPDAPGPRALRIGSSAMDELNDASKTVTADYYFFEGTNHGCVDLGEPSDGLVCNASTDMSLYTPHEVAPLHAAERFNLSHLWLFGNCGGNPGWGTNVDMSNDVLGLGDAIMTTLARVALASDPVAPMVFVPAGNFTMGQTGIAEPVHTVYLNAFYIDKYEVTNAQFRSFIDAGGYTTQAYWSAAGWSARTTGGWTLPSNWTSGEYHSGPAWPEFPVNGVSWYEAEAYANFAGKRLPTEAEWEKAARGTDQRTYPWGNSIDGSRANYAGSGDPYEGSGYSTPVGFYDGRLHPSPLFQTTNSPSFYGAYDMAGNVWEWVADWYGAYSASPVSNPTGPLTGSYRVLRGGAWGISYTGYLRSAYRYYGYPYDRGYYGLGFRCARTLP